MKLPAPIRWLLWPFSLLYGAAVRLRARLYRTGFLRQKQLEGVVISIGNLTVGGTGKTPLVLWMGEHLHGEGKRLGILSRGYGGGVRTKLPLSTKTFQQVAAGQHWSDETLMLAAGLDTKAHIGVGSDRYASGRAMELQGIEWFLLDDGFQHLQLARDVDIVLIDATNPFDGGFLLPAGRLREPISALARADIIVITRAESAPEVEAVVRRHTPAPIYYAKNQLEDVHVTELSTAPAGPSEWLGKKAFAFCGIGNPAAFFDDVRHWGMNLLGQRAFRDHHRYTKAEAAAVEQQAVQAGAEILVCTQKDTYNLPGVCFRRFPLYACHVTMRVTQPGEFWDAVFEIIRLRAGSTAAPSIHRKSTGSGAGGR